MSFWAPSTTPFTRTNESAVREDAVGAAGMTLCGRLRPTEAKGFASRQLGRRRDRLGAGRAHRAPGTPTTAVASPGQPGSIELLVGRGREGESEIARMREGLVSSAADPLPRLR